MVIFISVVGLTAVTYNVNNNVNDINIIRVGFKFIR